MVTEAVLQQELRRIAPELAPSIARLPMPAYILDRNGVVRWLNMAAVRHFGDMRGKRITQIVEPEFVAKARQEFAAKLLGTVESTEETVAVPHRGWPPRRGRHQLDAAAPARLDRGRVRAGRPDGRAAARTDELGRADAASARRAPLHRHRALDREHREDARHLDGDGAQPRTRADGTPGCPHTARGRDPRPRARARLTTSALRPPGRPASPCRGRSRPRRRRSAAARGGR